VERIDLVFAAAVGVVFCGLFVWWLYRLCERSAANADLDDGPSEEALWP
jgi:hypothetical protein